MTTGTYTESSTFTLTHARHMAAKVAADLKRMQRFYDQPSDFWIAQFEAELIELLKEKVLDTVVYGFQRNGNWIPPTLRYTGKDLLGGAANDDDPGLIPARADISGASFYTFLTYNASWRARSAPEQAGIKSKLPFQRVDAATPGVHGYFADDRTYSAGGHALNRATVRSF